MHCVDRCTALSGRTYIFNVNNGYNLQQYDCGLLQCDILLIIASNKISASFCRTDHKDGGRSFLRNAGKHHQTRRRHRQKYISLHTHRGQDKKKLAIFGNKASNQMPYVFWRIPWWKNQSCLSLVALHDINRGKLMWRTVSTMQHQKLSRVLIKIFDLAMCWEVHLTNILQSFGEKQLIYSTSRQIIIHCTLQLMIRLIIYFHLYRNLRSLSLCRTIYIYIYIYIYQLI